MTHDVCMNLIVPPAWYETIPAAAARAETLEAIAQLIREHGISAESTGSEVWYALPVYDRQHPEAESFELGTVRSYREAREMLGY